MSTYSDLQLDALGELANIGSGTAAGALSSMIGLPVDVSVPNARALSLADAVDAAGPPEQPVTAVALPVIGDLEGIVLMIFSAEDATRLCSVLGVEAGTEMGLSALSEIGNIVGASYLRALGTTTGQEIEPGPPQAATDMLGAVVSSILAASADTADMALLLDSALRVEGGNDASISFILVPSTASVRGLLAKLGIN
jgi:chemotaxis protein CheC